MKTQASEISNLFDGDGQRWEGENGDLVTVCQTHAEATYRVRGDVSAEDHYLYQFEDGSVIRVTPAYWDVPTDSEILYLLNTAQITC